MISASDHQLRVWQNVGYSMERIDHQFEALVCSPFAERQDAVFRISSAGKIRVFGSLRQNAMRPDMNILVAIFLGEDSAIARHQD